MSDEILDREWPTPAEFGEKEIHAAFKQCRFFRSDVRLMLGRISTEAELRERRERAMRRSLT